MIRHTLPPDPDPILWTARQAAAALQVSERTLYQWTKDGLMPAVRIKRIVRYSPETIHTWLQQQEQAR